MWIRVLGAAQLTQGFPWDYSQTVARIREGLFIHTAGAWVEKAWIAGAPGNLSLSLCGLAMWSLQHGGFKVVGLLTWQLRAPKIHVQREKTKQKSYGLLWPSLGSHFCHSLLVKGYKGLPRPKKREHRPYLLMEECHLIIRSIRIGYTLVQTSLENTISASIFYVLYVVLIFTVNMYYFGMNKNNIKLLQFKNL